MGLKIDLFQDLIIVGSPDLLNRTKEDAFAFWVSCCLYFTI